jgi:hypothetical protein
MAKYSGTVYTVVLGLIGLLVILCWSDHYPIIGVFTTGHPTSTMDQSVRFGHNRSDLLQLNNKYKVCEQTWSTIKELGIQCVSPTHRGKRAGSRKQRKIGVVSSTRLPKHSGFNRSRPVRNMSNLRSIPHVKPFPNLTIHTWNAQSVRNKDVTLVEHVLLKDVDIMLITESWLRKDDMVVRSVYITGQSFFVFHF